MPRGEKAPGSDRLVDVAILDGSGSWGLGDGEEAAGMNPGEGLAGGGAEGSSAGSTGAADPLAGTGLGIAHSGHGAGPDVVAPPMPRAGSPEDPEPLSSTERAYPGPSEAEAASPRLAAREESERGAASLEDGAAAPGDAGTDRAETAEQHDAAAPGVGKHTEVELAAVAGLQPNGVTGSPREAGFAASGGSSEGGGPQGSGGAVGPGAGFRQGAGAVQGSGAGQAMGAGRGSGGAGAADGALLAHLRDHAQRCYPRAASRRNTRGIVEVSFCVDGAGRPAEERVVQTSGSRLLDAAAIDCVIRGSVPLPAPVDCYTVPIRFFTR